MKVKAYSKINLTLDILNKRDDGFHTLKSVLVPISLYDSITVEKSGELSFSCDIPELRGDDNYCVRAAKLFFQKTGISGGAAIKLQKHIPYPAGLGGGSSDAAAVLNCLNALYDFPLTREELLAAGAAVGSDVPFCMAGVPSLCEGRGEILTHLDSIPKLYITVAIGGGRMPTSKAFAAYDESAVKPTDFTDKFVAALKNGDRRGMTSAMGNAFTDVCAKLCPETKEMRSRLRSCGAEAAILSGSGPSVFGVFAAKERSVAAAKDLRARGFFAVDCETLENVSQ